MTTSTKQLTFACLIAIALTPLSGGVFAQSEDEVNVEELSQSTTTEDVLSELGPLNEELWYKSEILSGENNIGDFVVGPGRIEIEVDPGETIVQEVMVTNRISAKRTFGLEIEDAVGTTDGSEAIVLTGKQVGPYSIRDFISFPKDTFTLKLGERARIPVTVTIPPNIEPGGYYGSILVSTVRDDGTSGEGVVTHSPVVARVGSLFFIRVRGEAFVEGEVKEVSTVGDKWWYESGPVELGVLTENSGSVHINPYGELSITNMLGEEVGFVELEPWFVLPKSLRVREVTWDREFLLGRYKVTAKINRGYDNIVDEVQTTFWVLPWKIVLGTLSVLFIIIFFIRTFLSNFEFKRK
jgi:hypothetical protein